jgi:POT family proton-dependent oligopeptide transporter
MAAIVAMGISLIIYILNKKKFPDPAHKVASSKTTTSKAAGAKPVISKEDISMSVQEIKQRIWALFAVFGVVIFFWMSFHQNGYSLTYFARDYINLSTIDINLGVTRLVGPELFQSINPFFVVFLSPLMIWFFGHLRKTNREPSAPMKIAVGMGIAAVAYLFFLVISMSLPAKGALNGMSSDALVAMKLTPMVMVGMYFILTIAELFIAPLGLAFVAKVAPPHLQGLMQGCWLAATAVGNLLVIVGGILYTSVPLWACWMVFAVACGLSMIVMLSMVRWLERVAK